MNKLSFLALLSALIFAPLAPTRAAAPVVKDTRNAETRYDDILKFFRDTTGAARSFYGARTGYPESQYNFVAEGRPWLEHVYAPAEAAKLDGLIKDLKSMPDKLSDVKMKFTLETKTDDVLDERLSEMRNESLEYLALMRLEKAQFVTNSPADFKAAAATFEERAKAVNKAKEMATLLYGVPNTESGPDWKRPAPLMAAHIRALVGAGELKEAYRIAGIWGPQKENQGEWSVLALVEALDMVGDYTTGNGLILSQAVAQIQRDGGKYVPDNQKFNNAALSLRQRHLREALKVAPSPTLLPLQRARLAGALAYKDARTAEETAFIKAAPALIEKATGQPSSASARLAAAQVDVGGNAAEQAEAEQLVASVKADSPFYAPAANSFTGYVELTRGNLEAAEKALDEAIKADPMMAYAANAQNLRAEVYRRTGKTELAQKEGKAVMQLARLMQQLAGPQTPPAPAKP